MKTLKKLQRRLKQTNKAVQLFINQTKKNYQSMRKKLKKIWVIAGVLILAAICMQSCNVTRKVTTESSYYQKGDTTCTIVTKTIESYDAVKKGVAQ